MPYFKCIKAHTEKTVIERTQMRKRNDTVTVVESVRVIDIAPGAYGHEGIKVGGVYEIKGDLAQKARANTEYFEEVEKPKKLSSSQKPKPTPPVIVEQIKQTIRAMAD